MVKLRSVDKLKGTADGDSRTCNHPYEKGRMAQEEPKGVGMEIFEQDGCSESL